MAVDEAYREAKYRRVGARDNQVKGVVSASVALCCTLEGSRPGLGSPIETVRPEGLEKGEEPVVKEGCDFVPSTLGNPSIGKLPGRTGREGLAGGGSRTSEKGRSS